MPEYRKPPCIIKDDNIIGSGGNSNVYNAYNSRFVCKVFLTKSRLSTERQNIRYKRFCKEICIQKELSQKMRGVLPVEDFCYNDIFIDNQPAWFMMPKAYKFNIKFCKSFIEKIKDLIELGEIIEELHSYNMAHRDIKPKNILIYNSDIYLSDYGLVWIKEEDEPIGVRERMGPIKIMPPELEINEDINECDYRKSDVYLFAKLVWMYLKGDEYGFKGPYNRGAKQIYLDKEIYLCPSFDPIHDMMLGATKDNWQERISISDCLAFLREQLALAENQMSEDEINNHIYREKILLFDSTVVPSVKVYNELEQINSLLNSIIPGAKMEFSDGLESWEISPKRYKYLSNSVLVLYEEIPNGNVKRTLLSIISAEKHEGKIVLKTSHINEEVLRKYRNNQWNIIDGDYNAVIISPF